MTALLLLIGAALLIASTDKKKKGNGMRPPPGLEIPIGPGSENFESIGTEGHMAYKRSVAAGLIRDLLFRIAIPTEADNVVMVMPGPGGAVGPAEWGAYYGLESLHDQGYGLWVPITFHWPVAATAGQLVVFLPPGEAPPLNPEIPYALLIMPDEPWPSLA